MGPERSYLIAHEAPKALLRNWISDTIRSPHRIPPVRPEPPKSTSLNRSAKCSPSPTLRDNQEPPWTNVSRAAFCATAIPDRKELGAHTRYGLFAFSPEAECYEPDGSHRSMSPATMRPSRGQNAYSDVIWMNFGLLWGQVAWEVYRLSRFAIPLATGAEPCVSTGGSIEG